MVGAIARCAVGRRLRQRSWLRRRRRGLGSRDGLLGRRAGRRRREDRQISGMTSSVLRGKQASGVRRTRRHAA